MPMTSSCSEPNAPAADEDCGGSSTGIKPTKRLPAQRKGLTFGRRGDLSTRLESRKCSFPKSAAVRRRC